VACAKTREQIKRIQFKTKKIVGGSMLGGYSTKHRGSGFDFDQVREYAQGDDLRFIDWKSTARNNKLLTKQYFIERNYRILIALDISASSFMGIGQRSKYSYLSEIAAIFSLVAEYGKDEVGLILFSDHINFQLPIKRGKAHSLKILEAIFSIDTQIDINNYRAGTNLDFLFQEISREFNKKSLVVVISDFIDEHDYVSKLKALQARHDVVVVRYLDELDRVMPSIGILPICDAEGGTYGMLDTRFAVDHNSELSLALKDRVGKQDKFLRSCGIDILPIGPDAHPVQEVVKFFRKRLTY
jgi:uncharacterized protein (DUF58 family)